MNLWNNIIGYVEYYVLNTSYTAKEIQSALLINEGIVLGMIGLLDSLNALRIKWRADEPVIKRLSTIINERKQSKVNRLAQDAFDSITK